MNAIYKNKIHRVMAIDFYGDKIALADDPDKEFPKSIMVKLSKVKFIKDILNDETN